VPTLTTSSAFDLSILNAKIFSDQKSEKKFDLLRQARASSEYDLDLRGSKISDQNKTSKNSKLTSQIHWK